MPQSKEKTMAMQDAWLLAFGECGTVRKACIATETARSTVYGWIDKNLYGFKDKKQIAWDMFKEYLQDLALERIKGQGVKDNPVLLMAYLNAFIPEYFKRDSASTDSTAKELMAELKRLRTAQEKVQKKDAVEQEEDSARKRAIDEVEKILSRQRESDDNIK